MSQGHVPSHTSTGLHQWSRFRAHSLLEHAISGARDGAVSQARSQLKTSKEREVPCELRLSIYQMGGLPPCGNFADSLSYFSRPSLVLV